jgi:hypothetical protein
LEGLTDVQIAEQMSMSTNAIRLIRSSPRVQHEISIRRREHQKASDEIRRSEIDTARLLIENAAADAARTHIDIMRNPELDARVRQSSATEILDLAFGREGSSKGTTININANQVALLTKALEESYDEVQMPEPSNVTV